MWDAYRGTRSRGGLFLSLLPLSLPLQLGVRRGAAPRLGLNASMLSQRRAFLRALNVQWQQSSTHAIAWLAGWQWNLLSPPPSPPSAGLSFLISLHTENHLASYLGTYFGNMRNKCLSLLYYMCVIFDIFVHVYILVIYVIYLGTGWAHSRRVLRIVERRKERIRF